MLQLDTWVTITLINHRTVFEFWIGKWYTPIVSFMLDSITYYTLYKGLIKTKPYCFITSPVLFMLLHEYILDRCTTQELKNINEVLEVCNHLITVNNMQGFHNVQYAAKEANKVLLKRIEDRHDETL